MAIFVTLTLLVEVNDPQALFATAYAYMKAVGSEDGEISALLGSEAAPEVGACCAMLLDRSELLGDGAEVSQHEIEVDDGEGDEAED
ncbi:hypothetical protein [Caulobacter sp. Root343]|uniref:hypothetical protein n=1 Tax=Caulobacter sp. Root343 TaxID=1736520 RepID=UPI0006F37E63|nr:hypothetical protein [Caulobacter sp. Root343]KQV66665.1 hypothetical protein ASC70_12595 [Caulobacter sp. Root343]